VIASTHNRRIVKAVRLKKRALREKDRAFLVEGAQGVLEALAAQTVSEVFVTAPAEERRHEVTEAAAGAGVPLHEVSDDVMAHLTSTVTPQGVVAVSSFVDVALDDLPEAARFLPVLMEVRDPGNAGTILRSADAAGAPGVVFTRSSVDVYNPKTVRASAGSLFHVPVVRQADPEALVTELRGRGWTVLAASAGGDRSVYETELTEPTAVLFGNEARGLSEAALALADATIRVPIAGRAESLNLAAAATLVIFEWARQAASGTPALSHAGTVDDLARLVAGAAHDIRSPLTAVKAFASTLASRWERLTEEERRFLLDGAAHESVRLELVVAQLVDAARLASGQVRLTLEPIRLLDAVNRLVHDVGFDALGIPIEVTGGETTVSADSARLRSIVSAMVEGVAWWGEEGPVRISVTDRPGPQIRVARTRPTVAAGEVERMFVPRAPGTGSGTKIGLFVARGLAEAHGGSLRGEAGADLELTLTLPASHTMGVASSLTEPGDRR
jgi:RNA methyltransferase, TrmH family